MFIIYLHKVYLYVCIFVFFMPKALNKYQVVDIAGLIVLGTIWSIFGNCLKCKFS